MNFRTIQTNVIVFAAAALMLTEVSSAAMLQEPETEQPATMQQQGSATKPASESKMDSKPAASDDMQSDQTEEAKAFAELRATILRNQREIDKLYRNLPVGFPERRLQSKARIEELTELNKKLKAEVFTKAKAALASSESPTPYVVSIVRRKMVRMVRPQTRDDKFNPAEALELIQILKEKQPDDASLLEFEFFAYYAIEKFDEAQQSLVKLNEMIERDLSGYLKEVQTTNEKYQKELAIRREEASRNDLPRVRLTTSEGDITLELYEDQAPNTVANFIHLIRDQKFYDEKLFHLVKPGEYCQSGSPNGDGVGGAGYYIPCECFGENIRSHFRGTITMIAPQKDKGSSQFFITQQPNPHTFDGKYTAFGRVIDGMDVVMKLKNIDLSGRFSASANASKIIKAEVLRTRQHAYMPEKITSSFGSETATTRSGRSRGGSNSDDVVAPGAFDLLIDSKKEDDGKQE